MYAHRILFSLPQAASSQLRGLAARRISSPLAPPTSFSNALSPVTFRSYAVVRGGARGGTQKADKPKPKARPTATATATQEQVPSAYQDTQYPPSSSQYNQYPPSSQYAQQGYTEQYYDGRSAADHVNESVSLQAFLKRSMVTTAAAVGGAALSAAFFMQIPFVIGSPLAAGLVGMVGSIGALMGMGAMQPSYTVDQAGIIKAEDPPARLALFGGLLVSQGLAISPFLAKVAHFAPMAIPVAGALSVATMAGMCAYALKQPQGSMLKWGPALYVGMFGLIGAGLVNIFVGSSTLSLISAGAGVLVFSGFTAYDTHVAIQEHAQGRPDHLFTAANFYMNFVNLFLDYLRLIQGWFSD